MRALALVCALGLSCANVQPVVVTGQSIIATGKTFEATAAVIDSLHASGAIGPSQYAGWCTFALRFKASYHAARLLYDSAAEGGDVSTQQLAANIIADFIAELGTYEALIRQIVQPDGGTS